MKHIYKSLPLCLFAIFALDNLAFASRIPMSQRDAWNNSNVFVIKAKVGNPSIDKNTARYPVEIVEILKSGAGGIPNVITVLDAHYNSTARTLLESGMVGILFVGKSSGSEYLTYRELDLNDSVGARNALRGLKLFLRLISISDKAEQRHESLKAWQRELSDPEKKAVLDVMWETRNSEYAALLMEVAKGKDSPNVRAWAITILTYIDKTKQDEELIVLLDDPDYHVRRQTLLFLSQHNVVKAVPKIEKIVDSEVKAEYAWQAVELKKEARKALIAIAEKKAE